MYGYSWLSKGNCSYARQELELSSSSFGSGGSRRGENRYDIVDISRFLRQGGRSTVMPMVRGAAQPRLGRSYPYPVSAAWGVLRGVPAARQGKRRDRRHDHYGCRRCRQRDALLIIRLPRRQASPPQPPSCPAAAAAGAIEAPESSKGGGGWRGPCLCQ